MPLALQSNALTTLANLAGVLSITTPGSSDDLLTRLINGASDTIERYCGRRFAYVASELEDVPGYGTELIHLARTPIWQVQTVVVMGQAYNSDYWKIDNPRTGSIFMWNGWPDTAPIELSASPHPMAGYEDKAIEVGYSGGYALPAANRLASDCPQWVANHAYATPGLKVTNGDYVYLLLTAGTSASSGGPTGKAASITDNGCVWQFLTEAFPLPSDLEEGALQLATFRYRRLGKDLSVYTDQIGRTARTYTGKIAGPDGIPQAIADTLDLYRLPR